MHGSILVLGGNKKARQKKAWEILMQHGFKFDNNNRTSPDLLIVQKESEKKSIGIAQAREIKDFMRERPFEKKIKAVVVEDAQLFTDDAQGSLLKILEEPPFFGLIILLCDKEGSLLPTVVSRCQKITVSQEKPRFGDYKDVAITDVRVDEQDKESARLKGLKAKSPYNLSAYAYEQIFDLAEGLSANGKYEALEFLEQVLREDIKNGAPLFVVQKMEKAIKELKEANVALKFALEYLFLLHMNLPN